MPENKNTLLDTLGLLTEAEVRHRKQWRAQPSLAKSYQKGHNLTEIQEEFVWETHDGDNQRFPVPINSHRLAPEPPNPPLPSCFNGDYNLQLTGGNTKERQKRTKNKKATIFYRTYHNPAQEFAEEKWQTGEKEITILKDRDIHTHTHTSHKISGYSALSRRIRSAPTRSTPQYIPQNYVLSFIFFIIFSTIHFVSHQLPPQRTFTKSRLLYVH